MCLAGISMSIWMLYSYFLLAKLKALCVIGSLLTSSLTMWFANLRKRLKISEEKYCATSKPTGILEACVITSITTALVILPLLFWFLSHQPDRTMWSTAPPPGMYTVYLCVAWTTLNHTLNFTSPLQQISWSMPGGTSFGELCVVLYTGIFLGDWRFVQNVFFYWTIYWNYLAYCFPLSNWCELSNMVYFLQMANNLTLLCCPLCESGP